MRTYRIAVVDIGSNTLKFSIADVYPDGSESLIQADARTVRLAFGVAATGQIDPSRARHAVEAMVFYDQVARALNADAQLSVATAALRLASNGSQLIDQIQASTRWKVHVISGDEEARLAFEGSRAHLPETGSGLLLDIGGGSTEAIHIVNRQMVAFESNAIGSGTLADATFTQDPPGMVEVLAAQSRAASVLAPSPVITAATGSSMVLSGGNGQFLAGFAEWDRVSIPFDPGRFINIVEALASTPATETAAYLGIAEERARLLPAGAAIAHAAIEISKPSSLMAIPSGIRGGLIAQWLADHAT